MKKLLFDFFPIAIFFAVYKYADKLSFLKVGPLENAENIIIATAILIPATLFQVVYAYWKTRKIERMYLITLALVVVMGGATVILQDKVFIQWKPTVVNWLFAIAFLGSEFVGKKNILERMMGGQIELPKNIWSRLNYLWTGFFVFAGAINIYVAFSGQFTEEQWVNFKLFGMLGLTLVFVILQGLYLARHVNAEQLEQFDSNHNADK